ncbi:hypothetical protein [Hoeflea sp. 108]|jgi:hypothetical protein|uniref:hypothetical protein n=1 Tax=Hoeflea sp. 108 TaxID=1116369 RepID=UPI001FD8D072|nr:hypothetical protein [Hoeflea sp. 108]
MSPVDTTDSDLRARVTALEHWRTQREIAEARKDEQWKHMDQRFTDLDKKIDGLNGTLTWIVRLIIGGIISGIVAFMLSGGFRAL